MPASLKANEHSLQEIFGPQFAFRIPGYQRPYSWTKEETQDLLNDIETALENRTDGVPGREPYFLGSIVLVKDEHKPEADVIDGQQRLTTLTILLAVLRKTIEDGKGEQLRERLFEEADEFAGRQARYRLALRPRDDLFFRTHIQNLRDDSLLFSLDPATLEDAQKRLRENTLFLWKELCERPDEKRRRLASFVLQHCYLVVVSATNQSWAYRLFRVLNDRGKDLSDTDVLKAEILGAVPKDREPEYVEKWEDLEAELGREQFETLFAHIRSIKRKAKINESLLEEIREHVRPADDPVAFIDQELIPLGNNLLAINQESYLSSVGAESVNRLFAKLKELDNQDWVPVTLAYLTHQTRTANEIVLVLTKLERLAAAMMICSEYRNHRVARYAMCLEAIEIGDQSQIIAALELTQIEKQETLKLISGDLYTKNKACQYVLRRLDESLSGGAATYSNAITIEHVLPQSPKAQSNWTLWFTKEEQAQWVHRLGNLVLLSRRKNAEASNLDFRDKIDRYFRTQNGVATTATVTTVLVEEEWTPQVVEKRQREFIKILTKLWSLDLEP